MFYGYEVDVEDQSVFYQFILGSNSIGEEILHIDPWFCYWDACIDRH